MLALPLRNPAPDVTEVTPDLDGRPQVVHLETPIEGSTTGDGR